LAPIIVAALAALALAGCGPSTTKYPSGGSDIQRTGDPYKTPQEKSGSVFGGDDGIVLFGENSAFQGEEGGGGQGIGVNSYLWRASLDTVSFMPLASADPFGGVIITDWHSPAETPDERFKVNVYILGRQLRGDGIRAAVFRQKRDLDGSWVDAPVDPQTATDLENAILTRARQLRIAGVE
jgi:hypothetical protein